MTDLSALKAIADSATDASSQTATVPLDGLKALLAVVEAAEVVAECAIQFGGFVKDDEPLYVLDDSLGAELDRGALDPDFTLGDLRRLASALAALHDTEGR